MSLYSCPSGAAAALADLSTTSLEGGFTVVADKLADASAAYLLTKLRTDYGQGISEDHETALRGFTWLAQAILEGNLAGRYRFALPCGMGKTTGVRAVVRSVASLGLSHPIIVACSKVEQLCELKRKLIHEDGVPAGLVGLMHSYQHDRKRAEDCVGGFASEPSEGHDRQFLLVTHANVKAGELKRWMVGRERALMFFDESLIVSEALTIPLMAGDTRNSIAAEVAALQAMSQFNPSLAEVAAWSSAALASLAEAVRSHGGDEVLTVMVPNITSEKAAEFRRLRVFATEQFPNIAELLKVAEVGAELRVFTNHETRKSLLSYTVTVPDELQNVIVLDASDPIRELVHHDRRMRRAEDVVPCLSKFRAVAGGMSSTKRYSRTHVYFAQDAGGRDAMRRAFSEGETTWALEKLVRLIKSKPSESFLIFTYKDRDGVKYERTIFRALERAGIEPLELMPEGNARICVLTWGMETASNDYRHCQNVVLLGVIFQPMESVAGSFLGQVDDLKSPELHRLVHQLVYAECVHSIYQAANRGSMREVEVIGDTTEAKPCSLYVIHRDAELRSKLEKVMPGATWSPWREPGEGLAVAEVSLLIARRLQELEARGYSTISATALKREVAAGVPNTTWRRARDEALRGVPWQLNGRSIELICFG